MATKTATKPKGFTIPQRITEGPYTEADFVGNGQFADKEWPGNLHLYLLPFTPDCALLITDHSGETEVIEQHRLDRKAVRRGLTLMRDNCPHHWKDLISGNEDAITGDVFLQLAVFGEVIYG